jgi:perosamine synthetase
MSANTLALLGGPKAITRTEELARVARWPIFGEEEQARVLEVLSAADVYAENGRFEEEFKAYTGARFAIAQNNGTSTLHAAYFAAGVGPGDEVITAPYTWHLQVSPILALHALPVFVDIDPASGCIDPAQIEAKLSPRTKAIAVLHAFGAVAPMDEIMAIARRHGLPVIEDCSHAHGATYKGLSVGTLGDIGCFSLQGSKLMTAIEGGVLITDNAEYYERVCLLAHYERLPRLSSEQHRRFYDPTEEMAPTCFGFKYRMHPLAAALARVQLQHLEENNAVRRRNMGRLTRELARLEPVITPAYERLDAKRIWLNYIAQYHGEAMTGVSRDRFVEALRAEGLPASSGRVGYLPIYWNPLYEERVGMWADGAPFDGPAVTHRVNYQRGDCPEAEAIWRRSIGLPMLHQPCSDELLTEIVAAVEKTVRHLPALRAMGARDPVAA